MSTTEAVKVANEALDLLSEIDALIIQDSNTRIGLKIDKLFGEGMCPSSGALIDQIDLDTAPSYILGKIARYSYGTNYNDEEGNVGWRTFWPEICNYGLCDCGRGDAMFSDFTEYQLSQGNTVVDNLEWKLNIAIYKGQDPAPWYENKVMKMNFLEFPDLYQ